MGSLKIEKNIPLPIKGRTEVFRLAEKMSIGDSVFFPDGQGKNSLLHRLRSRRVGAVQAKVTIDGVDGIRVWATEFSEAHARNKRKKNAP